MPEGTTVAFEADVANGGGVRIGWSANGYGFGEMTLIDDGEGNLKCDSEAMSQEFCEAVLAALAKKWALT